MRSGEFFFFNDTATTEIYTLSLHDALPICADEILHGDDGRVVGAGDGDVDLPGNQTAVLVVERDGEALDLGLAGGEILNRGRGNRVGPGQLAAGAGAGGVGVLDRGERAQRGADRGAGRRNQMHVGEVDVGEGDDACVREIAGRGDQLGDRADEILHGDDGRVRSEERRVGKECRSRWSP